MCTLRIERLRRTAILATFRVVSRLLAICLVLSVSQPGIAAPLIAAISQYPGGKSAILPGGNGAIVDKGYNDGVEPGDWFDIVNASGTPVGTAQATSVRNEVSILMETDLNGTNDIAEGVQFIKRAPAAMGVEPALQVGHEGEIDSLSFVRSDQILVSAEEAGPVKFWDVKSGRVLATREIPAEASIFSMARAPQSDEFVTGTYTGYLQRWDIRSARVAQTLSSHTHGAVSGRVGGVSFSSDGRVAASATWDGQITVWNTSNWTPARSFKDESIRGMDVAISAAGDLVVTGGFIVQPVNGQLSFRCVVSIWRISDGTLDHTLECGDHTNINRIAFSSDSRYIVAGSEAGDVYIWDQANHDALKKVPIGTIINAMSVSPDSSLVATNGPDKMATVINLSNGERKALTQSGAVSSVAFSSDGKQLAIGCKSGALSVWNLDSMSISQTFSGRDQAPGNLAISSDGDLVAISLHRSQIQLWDLASGQPARRLDSQLSSAAGAMDFSPDGKTLGLAGDGEFELLDVNSGASKIVKVPLKQPAWAYAPTLIYASSGKYLAYQDGDEIFIVATADNSVIQSTRLLDGIDDATQMGLKDTFLNQLQLQFSPDGSELLAASNKGLVRSWAFHEGYITAASIKPVPSADFVSISSDGRYLAEGEGMEVRVLDLQDAAKVERIELLAPNVHGLMFSHDGRSLAVGEGSVAKVWDIQGNRLARSYQHASILESITFSADDRLVLTSCTEDQLTVWGGVSPRKLVNLLKLGDKEWLAMDSDGFFDGTEKAWQLVPFHTDSNPLKLYAPEQFFNLFYQPALAANVTAFRISNQAYLRRVGSPRANLDINKYLNSTLPKVAIVQPNDGAVAPTGTVPLDFAITNTGSGVRDCRVFRNRSLTYIRHGDLSANDFRVNVDLAKGSNIISAYCFNSDGLRSETATVHVTNTHSDSATPVAYIVAVGIDNYLNPDFLLQNAKRDAGDITIALGNSLGLNGRFKVVPVVLTDEKATKENILAAVARLSRGDAVQTQGGVGQPSNELQPLSQAKPDDVVVFFFAGHGMQQLDHYYFLPQDFGYRGSAAALLDKTDVAVAAEAAVAARSISDDELARAFENVDAGHVIVIADSCSSGEILEKGHGLGRLGPFNAQGFAQFAYEKGLFVVTAAQSNQAAIDGYVDSQGVGHGLLTYALIDALRQYASYAANPHRLLATEWLEFTAQHVHEIDDKDDVQEPVVYHPSENAESAFAVIDTITTTNHIAAISFSRQ